MIDILPWLNYLQCSDCHTLTLKIHKQKDTNIVCTKCQRTFKQTQDIWNFLPTTVMDLNGKEKERRGWQLKEEENKEKGFDLSPDVYLQLPYVEHYYYKTAAINLKIIMELGKPWQNMKVLELGAAECWATRIFTEAGSNAVAMDYDPYRMTKAQIILENKPINFLRLTGDGENIPFKANTFDRIFCCSVLHHFFDIQQAINEIARTLKPGGKFFAIHEAFKPFYLTKKKVVDMNEDMGRNIDYGINEQCLTAGKYRKMFQKAGLVFDILNPYLDTQENEGSLIIKQGIRVLDNPSFHLDKDNITFTKRGFRGKLLQILLRLGGMCLISNRRFFKLIRFQLLNWMQIEKIIIAEKSKRA